MRNLQAIPYDPTPTAIDDASDLATAISLVNDLKEKYNDSVNIIKLLLAELNSVSNGGGLNG